MSELTDPSKHPAAARLAVQKDLLKGLSPTERDIFEKHAGMLEFDGKLPRQVAEKRAYAEATQSRRTEPRQTT